MPDFNDTRQDFSLGETLGKTLWIFFSRMDVFLGLTLCATLPFCLTTLLFVTSLADFNNDTDDILDYVTAHLAICVGYVLFQAMLSIVLAFSVEAAMVRAAAEILAGKSPTWYACLCRGFHQFGALACARVLVWFFLISTLALVVGFAEALISASVNSYFLVTLLSISYVGVGFTVWTTTMILYPVIVIENKGPTDGIRRSFTLARGQRCYFFCCALCIWIARLFVLGLLQSFLDDASKVSSLISVAGVIITSFTSSFSLPLTSVLSTVMYVSARARRENFSHRDLLSELQTEEDMIGYTGGDERQVPLLSSETREGDAAEVPVVAENVILVDEKEVPADVPVASEVV